MRHVLSTRTGGRETAVALPAAIVMMVIAAIIVVAISMSAFSSRDRASDARDRELATGPAEEAVSAYARALSSATIGEHTGFSLTKAALLKYVNEQQANAGMCSAPTDPLCLVANANTAFPAVDGTYIPAADRFTVRRMVANGQYRFWQMMAIAPPQYGVSQGGVLVSPGGAAVIYVRGWQGAATTAVAGTRPVVMRADMRPPRISDFQMMINGRLKFGAGATINGRVHSNGHNASLFDQYKTEPAQITLAAGVDCTGGRLSTQSGSINTGGNASCSGVDQVFEDSSEQASMLGTGEAIDSMRALCPAGGAPSGGPLSVACVNNPNAGFLGPYTVRLNPNGRVAITPGGPTIDASVAPGRLGAVVVLDRSVRVRGVLGSVGGVSARLTIVASNRGGIRMPETPSIRIENPGITGSALNDPRSSVGFIADGDVIADERRACPAHVRAAVIAHSGMLSRDPLYRTGTPGAPQCAAGFTIDGSIGGNLAPNMTDGVSGYLTRVYRWDPMLYNNPPPMYPIAGPWQTRASSMANFDCFTTTTATPPALKLKLDSACV